MKNRKLLMLSLLIIVMIFALAAAGCSSNSANDSKNDPPKKNDTKTNDTKTNDTKKPETAADPFEKHYEISLTYPDITNHIKPDDRDEVLKLIEEKFNITLKPVAISWSDYMEKTRLWAASGQLPDVVFSAATDSNLYKTWVDQGIVKKIPDDLSNYPHIEEIMNLNDVKGFRGEDGSMHFIPRQLAEQNELPQDRSFFIRKDWAIALGYDNWQNPQSNEELNNMLMDIAKNNPDGKGNAVGVTTHTVGFLGPSMLINQFPQQGYWLQEDGEYIHPALSSQQIDLLKSMRKLYHDGVLDKDFALPNLDAIAKFAQGQSAALIYQSKNAVNVETSWNSIENNGPFAESVGLVYLPMADDGNYYLPSFYTFWSETLINPKVDDEKMQRILALYDFLLSPEGQILTMYGFEDIDYKMEGEKLVIIRDRDAEGNIPGLGTKYPSTDTLRFLATWGADRRHGNEELPGGWAPETYKMSQDYLKHYLEIGTPIGINWEVNAFVKTLPTPGGSVDLNAELVRVIVGTDDIGKMWEEVINKLYQAGLQDQMDAVNARFK